MTENSTNLERGTVGTEKVDVEKTEETASDLKLTGLGSGPLASFTGLETIGEGEACGPDGCF